MAFKTALRAAIPDLLAEYTSDSKENLEIAQIHFGFNNTEVIKLLKNRGYAIATLNFKEVDAIEEQLDAYI